MDTVQNPIQFGLQMGAAGAAAGLGVAAIHRAIRLHRGNQEPVSVIKPMLAGALIGTVLGTGLAVDRYRRTAVPSPTKYAALNGIIKSALFDSYSNWQDAHPLASTAGYFVPGVGAAMSAADASRNFSRGEWMKGIGNTLMVPAGILGLGGLAGGLRGIAGATKGVKGVRNLYRAGAGTSKGTSRIGGALSRGWRGALGAVGGNLLNRVPANYLAGAERFGHRASRLAGEGKEVFKRHPLGKSWLNPTRPTAAMLAGMPLTMLGGEGGGTSEASGSFGSAAPMDPYQRYRGLSYISNADKSKLPFLGATNEADSPFEGYESNG